MFPSVVNFIPVSLRKGVLLSPAMFRFLDLITFLSCSSCPSSFHKICMKTTICLCSIVLYIYIVTDFWTSWKEIAHPLILVTFLYMCFLWIKYFSYRTSTITKFSVLSIASCFPLWSIPQFLISCPNNILYIISPNIEFTPTLQTAFSNVLLVFV